jgi:hypothetical protein
MIGHVEEALAQFEACLVAEPLFYLAICGKTGSRHVAHDLRGARFSDVKRGKSKSEYECACLRVGPLLREGI